MPGAIAMLMNRSAYAEHAGVTRTTLYVWINTGKLTAPALLDNGKVDSVLADAQLAARPMPAGERPPRPPPRDLANHSDIILEFRRQFLPAIGRILGDRHRGALSAAWRDFVTRR